MKKIDLQAVSYLRMTAVLAGVFWLAGAALLTAAVLYFSWPYFILWIAAAVLAVIVIIDVFVSPKIYYKVTRYGVFDNHIIVRKGFIFISTTLIPIKRIQGVSLRTGPLSRRHNLAYVRVNTASSMMELPPLSLKEGMEMKQKIMNLVKEEITDV